MGFKNFAFLKTKIEIMFGKINDQKKEEPFTIWASATVSTNIAIFKSILRFLVVLNQ